MIETLNHVFDAVAAVAFAVALAVLVFTPVERDGYFNRTFKWIAAAFFGIFLWLTGLDGIGLVHLGDLGDLFEDYAQVLPAVIALGGVYVVYATQQYQDVARAHEALAQSHDLMMAVMDEAPAGIVLLDTAGRIAFANAAAKDALDLEETESGDVRDPGWLVRGEDAGEPGSLRPLVGDEAYQGREVRLEWPSGWFVDLRVSGRPLSDSRERLGGMVLMFERA